MERKRRISAPFLRTGLNNYRQSKTAAQPENTIIALIQAGIADNIFSPIILRAADVALKERRKLVLAVRECPFSTIHLRNMYELSSMGAVILPLVLSYYNKPENLQDAARHLAGKILDQFGVEYRPFKRWEGMETDGILQRD